LNRPTPAPFRKGFTLFETFDHTADVGLRVEADTLAGLFEEAARGFSSLVVANLADVRRVEERTVRVEGTEHDFLLFDWLNELVYLLDHEHLVFSQFEVSFDSEGLTGICRGEKIDRARHQLEHEVKAITYHDLKVEQRPGGWLAEVILDI
jgi:SHS2 domain-containing protein